MYGHGIGISKLKEGPIIVKHIRTNYQHFIGKKSKINNHGNTTDKYDIIYYCGT